MHQELTLRTRIFHDGLSTAGPVFFFFGPNFIDIGI